MRRKEFLQKAALTVGGGIGLPYILPSGRLFARGGVPKADHVVLVMFAGGVRQQESILQRYLEDSQGVTGAAGNVMFNIFDGPEPGKKIVYGTNPAGGGTAGSVPIPQLLGQTLESQGTVFREVNAQSAGHYTGQTALITGNTSTAQGLKVRPNYPTIFEYLRKHAGFSAIDCWMISSSLTNSYNLLNSSDHPEYGLQYGANMFVPGQVFGGNGRQILGNSKTYSRAELGPMYEMKNFLDKSFGLSQDKLTSIVNTDDDKTRIKEFIKYIYAKQNAGQIAAPPVGGGDAFNISYAAEVLKYFKPKVLSVNLTGVDSCHSNFTSYLQNLHRADHATGWLWNYIQTQIPEMAGNTVILVAPECGRNLNPNPILDQNDWYAFDHSDRNAQRVWTVMAGKSVPSGQSVGNEGNPIGRLTDIVPTIADIFGVYDDVKNSGLIDPAAKSLYERM